MVYNQHANTPNPTIVPVLNRRGEEDILKVKKQIIVEIVVKVSTGAIS